MKIALVSPGRLRCSGMICALGLMLAAGAALEAQENVNFPAERAVRSAIFFPPFPPALDQGINRNIATGSGLNAPGELSDYTGEIFYPQLSTQFSSRALGTKLAQSLADYRAARRTLLLELQQALANTQEDEPVVRRGKLQALAQRQAPRLAALEKTAEQLRDHLEMSNADWSDLREWRLGDRERRAFSPVEIGMVMRAYAHYHKGLLPPQRRLLREVSLELAMAAETEEKAKNASSFVFFAPETARVIFPTDIPAPVAAKIADYLTRKSLLKKELYDAVYKSDGKSSIFSNPLRDLAAKHIKPLADLDALAEEIRLGLGSLLTRPPAPPRSPLPEVVVEKLDAHAKRRVVLQHAATTKMQQLLGRIIREGVPARLNYRFDDTGLKFVLIPAPGAANSPQVEAIRVAAAAIAEEFGRAFADLVNQGSDMRQEISDLLGTRDQRAIDVAAATALRLAAQRADAAAYQQYRTAVFEPGLSPEQRRLLFDTAIEALNLPLPRGEMQPTRRAGSW